MYLAKWKYGHEGQIYCLKEEFPSMNTSLSLFFTYSLIRYKKFVQKPRHVLLEFFIQFQDVPEPRFFCIQICTFRFTIIRL